MNKRAKSDKQPTAAKCDVKVKLYGKRPSKFPKAINKNKLNINEKYFSEVGEVLFKDCGLSGIVVFNLSAYFARSGSYDGGVSIDLMPKLSSGELAEKIKERIGQFEYIKDLFTGMFVGALSSEIFSRCKIDANKKTSTFFLILSAF